jgi:hypothetical protein
MMHHMSAVPLAVRAMPEALTFSTQRGFTLVDGSSHARFRTLRAGDALINLPLASHFEPTWWGVRLSAWTMAIASTRQLSPKD